MGENGKKYSYKDNFLNFKTLKFEGGLKDPHFKYGKNWRIDVDDRGGGINFKAKRDLPKDWWKKLTGKK